MRPPSAARRARCGCRSSCCARVRDWAPAAARAAHAGRQRALGRARRGRELAVRWWAPPESRRLNARYRGRDRPTNVLSFPAPLPQRAPRGARLLGDLVICPRVLRAEARAQAQDAARALGAPGGARRAAPAGYDHERAADARRMERREIAVLRRLGFANPVPEPRGAPDGQGPQHHRRAGSSASPRDWPPSRRTARSCSRCCARPASAALLDADALAMLEGVLDGGGPAGARHHGAARADGVRAARRVALARILPVVVESGHSRFPVMDEDRDDIVGILLAKDLLRLSPAREPRALRHPRVHAPGGVRAGVQAPERAAARSSAATATTWRSWSTSTAGSPGLVTIEDVIEQIVGDIDDEFDVEDDQNIRREAERQFTRARRHAHRRVQRVLRRASSPRRRAFDTVAGLVMKQLGRLPRRGESVTHRRLRVPRACAPTAAASTALRVLAPRDRAAAPSERAAAAGGGAPGAERPLPRHCARACVR